MDDRVLEEIKRKNMDLSDLSKLLPECETAQVPVYTELILGLPYETKQTWEEGHYKLLNYNQHDMVEVHLSMMLENSELNSQAQINKHEIKSIEVENYLNGDSNVNENGITEKCCLINSTKYMPSDDLIDSFMFSWMILTFHYVGYTQICSRYLNATHQMEYKEFYRKLFEYIKNSNGNINVEYQTIKHIITTYLTTGKLPNATKFNSGVNIIWNSLRTFPRLANNVIYNELAEFLKDIANDELIEFQKHFTVDIDRDYPYNLTIPSKIYDCIFNTKSDSTYLNMVIDSTIKDKNIDDFCRKIYLGRRASLSKVSIEVDK